MKEWYHKIRKYIGPLELVVIFLLVGGAGYFIQQHVEKKRKEKEILAFIQNESKLMQEEYDKIVQEQKDWEEGKADDFKVLDSIYSPFLVDSLCRYFDETQTTGFITMSKYAPYQRLLSKEKDYYMWINITRFFPQGQLVQITGIAQNEEVIQFHFKIDDNKEMLDNMVSKLDSTLKMMQNMQIENTKN